MNPHFIFNCLNLVQMHMNKNEMHEANEYLAQLAKLIRMNLLAIRQAKQYHNSRIGTTSIIP
ncbi:MAG: histidine kinase [Ferruginibacter sp.]